MAPATRAPPSWYSGRPPSLHPGCGTDTRRSRPGRDRLVSVPHPGCSDGGRPEYQDGGARVAGAMCHSQCHDVATVVAPRVEEHVEVGGEQMAGQYAHPG